MLALPPASAIVLILVNSSAREKPRMNSESFDEAADAARDAALAALIRRMAAGDEQALGALYDATLGKVYGLALRITGRPDAAEDVAAEVYHQAWRQAGRYDAARGRPLAWLLTMARSRALDSLRRRDDADSHPEPETLVEPQAAPGSDPVDMLLTVERDSALHAAIARLDPVQRQLLALAFYRGLSHQEIADHAHLPLGTVKSHIRKALLALHSALAKGVAAP
jgi:RNA polymerase sigma-70 factor (ECF subfamily)